MKKIYPGTAFPKFSKVFMKKRILAPCIAACCAVVLSGCAGCGSCAGCSGTTKNIAALSSNWYSNTSYKKIQPTFVDGKNKEIINYAVTQDVGTALNDNYSVRYSGGKYKTVFYATAFDKSEYTAEEYAEAYPDGLIVYYYRTELSFETVTYKFGDDERSFSGDRIITDCYFASVEEHLRPLYSREKIKSSSPAEYNPKSIDEAYTVNDYEYTTYYSYDGEYAVTKVNDGSGEKTKTVKLNKAANTVFDANSINIAVRASKLSADFTQAISVYAPSGNLQNYSLHGGTIALGESERGVIESEMIRNKLFAPETDDEGKNKPLDTVAVGLKYGGELSGVSPIYWFAAIGNKKNNRGRATMVKMSVPVPYSLGTLNYTLEKIDSTLYR